MPLNKKLVFIPFFLLVSTSVLSGCILEDLIFGASFDITSYSVTDSEGFPAINIFFSASNKVSLKMYNKDSDLIDTNYFYDDGNTTLNIGSYQENIESGTYQLRVYNSDNGKIHDEDFSLNAPNVEIALCEQKWWKDGGTYYLMGLKFSLTNTGDAPAYPYRVRLTAGSEIVTGYVVPAIVLPGSLEDVYCYLYHEGVFEEDSFNVEILDKSSNIMATSSYSFDVRKNVYNVYYDISALDNILVLPYLDFLYDYYSSLDRIYIDDYSAFVFDKYDEDFIDLLIDRIILSLDYSSLKFNTKTDKQKVEYIASFVQGLDYKKDSDVDESYEYPRYPAETLYDDEGGGDCEDKAILTASLLNNLGYETALLRFPDHMAVGVKLEPSAVSGDYYIEDYDFLETTSPGYKCGQISDSEYESPTNLSFYPIEDRAFLLHSWMDGVIVTYKNTEQGNVVKVVSYTENLGSEDAQNVVVEGLFCTDTGLEFNNKEVTISEIKSGDKKKITMTVEIPGGYVTRFETRAYLDGEIVDSEQSKDYFI